MIYFIFILIYLLFLMGVGFWKSKSIKTQEDFVVAGRNLTVPVLVGTLMATWTGSGSLFSGGGLAYRNGYAALWTSVGAWLGIIFIFFIAQKIRSSNKLSVPHILEDRFNPYVAAAATLVTIIAYTTIVSYQFKGGGRVFELLLGAETITLPVLGEVSALKTGMIFTAIFAIGYTVLAGMLSVTYTDVLNGVVMLIGIAIAIPFVFDKIGGVSTFTATVPAQKWQLFGIPTEAGGEMGFINMLGLLIPTMLLLMGDANMYQRLLSAKDEKTAKKSVLGWVVAVVIVEILIVTLAFGGSALETGLDKSGSENIIAMIAKSHVPTIVGCMLLAALAAIIISTADSFLLVSSTNFSHDIYARFIRPDASQKELLLVNRISVIVLGILAFFLIASFKTILDAAYTAYNIYGTGITPALLAAFIWKRATATGAMLSILGGAGSTILCQIFSGPLKEATGIEQHVYIALPVSLFLLIAGSLLTQPKETK